MEYENGYICYFRINSIFELLFKFVSIFLQVTIKQCKWRKCMMREFLFVIRYSPAIVCLNITNIVNSGILKCRLPTLSCCTDRFGITAITRAAIGMNHCESNGEVHCGSHTKPHGVRPCHRGGKSLVWDILARELLGQYHKIQGGQRSHCKGQMEP